MAEKPWGGRFDGETDPRVEAFTESISFDHRLAAVDVRGAQAHARMLASVGLLTENERDAIVDQLDVILSEITSGQFAFHVEHVLVSTTSLIVPFHLHNCCANAFHIYNGCFARFFTSKERLVHLERGDGSGQQDNIIIFKQYIEGGTRS